MSLVPPGVKACCGGKPTGFDPAAARAMVRQAMSPGNAICSGKRATIAGCGTPHSAGLCSMSRWAGVARIVNTHRAMPAARRRAP